MQGSGTFSVEAVLGTAVPAEGKILILANGAYGERMAQIANRLRIPSLVLRCPETERHDPEQVRTALRDDRSITHVALAHCETTTGILNDLDGMAAVVRDADRCLIVDAMSSFGGIPMDAAVLGIDFLISSSNKCLQDVPGFGLVVARTSSMEPCAGRARSLSLDVFDQWQTMERDNGKWRFTSPTHVVRAFAQALQELAEEGGVGARHTRFRANHRTLVEGMSALGFACLLPAELRSPFITSFLAPSEPGFDFRRFYDELKSRGFVIYPGKVSQADTFRMGTIGDVTPKTMDTLLAAIRASLYWRMPA